MSYKSKIAIVTTVLNGTLSLLRKLLGGHLIVPFIRGLSSYHTYSRSIFLKEEEYINSLEVEKSIALSKQ